MIPCLRDNYACADTNEEDTNFMWKKNRANGWTSGRAREREGERLNEFVKPVRYYAYEWILVSYYSANRLVCLKFTYFISFCLQQDSIFKNPSRLSIILCSPFAFCFCLFFHRFSTVSFATSTRQYAKHLYLCRVSMMVMIFLALSSR